MTRLYGAQVHNVLTRDHNFICHQQVYPLKEELLHSKYSTLNVKLWKINRDFTGISTTWNNSQAPLWYTVATGSQFQTWHWASTSTCWHFTFGLCCHSNETHAPIANLPNTAQLQGTPYHSPKLHPGLCSSMGIWRGTDTHTYRHAWPIYISRRLRLRQNVMTTGYRCTVHYYMIYSAEGISTGQQE